MKWIIFSVLLNFAFGQIEKSSLTFVIDDTGSMQDDIDQVKDGVNLIFDTVVKSKASQIKDFVLVTFNDPTISFRTKTQSRDEFRGALSSIKVDGGGDCEEMSMEGIYEGLKKSDPGSFIYVFTDASAKDAKKLPDVQTMAIEKNIQIVFLLTGRCTMDDNDPLYQAYYKLAEATSGQVFHMGKQDVKIILNYIAEQIESPKTVITAKKFPPGHGHNLTFPVDDDMKSVIISESGDKPTIELKSPDGSTPDTETIVDLDDVIAVRIGDTSPGNYTAVVGSRSETSVVVAASTTIKFQHGFSPVRVPNIESTSTTPVPDEKTFLSIKLDTPDDNKIIITAELMDIEENVVSQFPLTLVDKKDKFYSTDDFVPPEFLFKVAVKGIDVNTGAPFRRISPTPIEIQRIKPGVDEKSPDIQIVGGPKIIAEFKEALKIACKVSAFPKPDVIWIDGSGNSLPSLVSTVKLPYDFIAILEVEKVITNSTYTCKASNLAGLNSASVEVETFPKEFFNVIEAPKDTTVEYEKYGKISCKVEAYPPATLTWMANGKEVYANEYYDISEDGSELIIKNMQLKLNGTYQCVAENDVNLVELSFKVSITGLEKPKIDEIPEIHGLRGNDTKILCRIVKGSPKPTIRWFYRRVFANSYELLNETSEVLHVENLDFHHSGVYQCEAFNVAGHDSGFTTLIVDVPPYIEKNASHVVSRHGERTRLWCTAYGVPRPRVIWLRNGVEILNDREHHIYRDHSLGFKGSLDNRGNFTCVASNTRGTATRTVLVDYIVPVTVDPPKQSSLELTFGSHVSLPCRADGYPQPTIKWIFYSDTTKKSIVLRLSDPSGSLQLRNLQPYHDGYYTCVAGNVYSKANITYHINVLAKPLIRKSDKRTYSAVSQDLVLTIPCKVSGNPKPDVTWERNGLNIPAGTEWYDIEDDGTLVIKNIDEEAAGTYVCQAKNKAGEDSEELQVVVRPFPDTITPTNTLNLKENATEAIECNIPHTRLDYIRWYKDERIITTGELTLRNVKPSDSGLYICRVSTFSNSKSSAVAVIVGSPPVFIDELEDIDLKLNYVDSLPTYLDCQAYGDPVPEVSWMHNGKKLTSTEMVLEFEMNSDTRGQYECIVKNDVGTISRTFEIISRECFLNLKDLSEKQPLIIDPGFLQLHEFEDTNGFLRILPEDPLLLYCPSGFSNFPQSEVIATCDGETNFKIDGNIYKFSELTCVEEIIPQIKRTGRRCSSTNSETVKIGFEFRDVFLEVYEICYDETNNIPAYVKTRVQRSTTDEVPKENSKWISNDLLSVNISEVYNCDRQIITISSRLRRWFQPEDDPCCFKSERLVDPADLPAGLPQKAADTTLNVVPQWSTCGAQNWELLENEIRNLAKSSYDELFVWTGTHGQLELLDSMSVPQKIAIRDSAGGEQVVPQYLWKVVQNPATESSLAIIQLNIPHATLADAMRHMVCRDICRDIPWMAEHRTWRDPSRGFTFCCSLQDFERAFRLEGLFGDNRKILRKPFYPVYGSE